MALELAPDGIALALLGFLRGEPVHAYELHHRLAQAEALGLVWRLKQSHLYALLAKLEATGSITSTMEPRGTRPPRKMLTLTERGHEAYKRWVAAPVAHGRDFRLEFLAKLYFAAQEGPAAVAALVAHQRAASQNRLDALRTEATRAAADAPFARLVLSFRVSQLEATLAWLESIPNMLNTAHTGNHTASIMTAERSS